ncbi:MAG: hypothetical protein ABI728_04160 [Betaproteobacteria bacterium]
MFVPVLAFLCVPLKGGRIAAVGKNLGSVQTRENGARTQVGVPLHYNFHLAAREPTLRIPEE